MVAEAPAGRRPRLQPVATVHVPCDEVSETSIVWYGRSETLITFTSFASTEELFVTVTVHVILPPSGTVVGVADFSIARSTLLSGIGGIGGIGGDVTW